MKRTILISGAGAGIGWATAKFFYSDWFKLAKSHKSVYDEKVALT